MIPRIIAAALVAAAIPLAASAETCPTNADLEDGIRLSNASTGFYVVFTQVEQQLYLQWITEYGLVPLGSGGVFAHPLAPEFDPITGVDYVYSDDVSGLSKLPETRQWDSNFVRMRHEEVTVTGTYSARFAGFDTLVIGNCNYAVWRVLATFEFESEQSTAFEVKFAPDLGIILDARLISGDRPERLFAFDEIAAE